MLCCCVRVSNILGHVSGVQTAVPLDHGPDEPSGRTSRRPRSQAQPQVRDRGDNSSTILQFSKSTAFQLLMNLYSTACWVLRGEISSGYR
jgi:hypothetical protein